MQSSERINIASGYLREIQSGATHLLLRLSDHPGENHSIIPIEKHARASGQGELFARSAFDERPTLVGKGEIYFDKDGVGVRAHTPHDCVDFPRTIELSSRTVEVYVVK